MFAVGAALGAGFVTESVVIAGVVAVLLHHRQPLHGLVARIGEDDARAIFRFVLIGLVILPLLPNRAFDRYQVLNPFEIWLMVVLIVGISLAAYIASRLLGAARRPARHRPARRAHLVHRHHGEPRARLAPLARRRRRRGVRHRRRLDRRLRARAGRDRWWWRRR